MLFRSGNFAQRDYSDAFLNGFYEDVPADVGAEPPQADEKTKPVDPVDESQLEREEELPGQIGLSDLLPHFDRQTRS